MLNIVNADFYRLRKGAAARNVIIGIFATILFVSIIFFSMTTDGFQLFIDDATSMANGITNQDITEINGDLSDIKTMVPHTATEIVKEILGGGILPFFLLPLIITIFTTDFSTGTYRNTLSYESSRTKVYLSKLVLSVGCCILLNLITLLFSLLIGGILFGFSGITGEHLLRSVISMLFLLPCQLGCIGLGHCLTAFTKKSSSTIAAYLVGLIVLSMVLQIAVFLPPLRWVALLDWSASSKMLAEYWTMPVGNILICVCSGFAVAIVTTAMGLAHYRKADMP